MGSVRRGQRSELHHATSENRRTFLVLDRSRLPLPAAAWNIFVELPMTALEKDKLIALMPYIGKFKGIAIITAEPMQVRAEPRARHSPPRPPLRRRQLQQPRGTSGAAPPGTWAGSASRRACNDPRG